MNMKEKCCSECVFWDCEKNRCAEWFNHKMPTYSPLHRCAEMRGKELKGQHTNMVILNDLDDMLSEIALENKIADVGGEK